MTAADQLPYGADVPLEAGLWAVALVVLAAGLVLAALLPALRPRRREEPAVACSTPGSLGRHPLEDPDPDGVRRCACGVVTSIPAGGSGPTTAVEVAVPRLSLVPRTDTRELAEVSSIERARAAGHPTVWEPPTERLLPRLVWPPR